jgi:peptidase U49-like protein
MNNCQQPLFLQQLFQQFEPKIRELYARAAATAGIDPSAVPLELNALSWQFRREEAEFAALSPPPRVAITWNGIASLWAASHAIARVARVMFEAQRKLGEGDDRKLMLSDYPTAGMGLDLFKLSLILAKNPFKHWVQGDWAPVPTAAPTSQDDINGNTLFFRALGWIIRHELAHLVKKHHDQPGTLQEDHFRHEYEADEAATLWLKGGLTVDPNRQAGAKPSPDELALEQIAVGIFGGIVWISQFECVPHAKSQTHPDAADRLVKVIDILDLREDSGALEIVSYGIKALIEPESKWTGFSDRPTARDAAYEAALTLSRHIQRNL